VSLSSRVSRATAAPFAVVAHSQFRLAAKLKDSGLTMEQKLSATQIGGRARALISDPKSELRVLSCVQGAIYIEDQWGRILWLTGSRAALHGRAILAPGTPTMSDVRRGMPCGVHGGHLRIGKRILVDLTCALAWAPAIPRGGSGGPLQWGRQLQEAIRRAARRSPSSGSPIRNLLRQSKVTDGALPRENRALGPLLQGAATLGSVQTRRDLPCALRGARGLVGLGEGLTPSGDDLLGGYLATLRLLDQAFAFLLGIDWAFVEAWVRSVGHLTSRLSHAILLDHACGEAGYPLWSLVSQTVSGLGEQDLAERAAEVSHTGHSSGWDMLAGVHCAAAVAASLAVGSPRRSAPALPASCRLAARRRETSQKEVLRVH